MSEHEKRPIYIKHDLANAITLSKIVTIHYFEFDKNFVFPGEVHNFWEMVYVDSGQVSITAGKTHHVLNRGEVIFHKPNEFHTISSNNQTPSNVFVISFVTTSKNMAFFKNKKTVLPDNLRPYIKTLIEEGETTFVLPFNNPQLRELKLRPNPPFGGQQIIKNTLEQLLIMLIREDENRAKSSHIFPDKESMDNHLVNTITTILHDNIYGRISVEEICTSLNYSTAYISKIFKSACGSTIIHYYVALKIKEAKKLIRENRYNFSQISDMLCFNNPHYFSRTFKKFTNMSPSEYQSSVKK